MLLLVGFLVFWLTCSAVAFAIFALDWYACIGWPTCSDWLFFLLVSLLGPVSLVIALGSFHKHL
jgi:hypothetical protein